MPDGRAGRLRARLGQRPELMFWVLTALVVTCVVVLTDLGRTAVDTKPQLYLNPDAVFAASLSAWQILPALGQRSYESGLLLPSLVASVLQGVGLPAWLIMRVIRVALVLVGMTGAAWLARRVVGPCDRWPPRVAAVVYVLHPYVLVAGATLPVLWPWALLPWALGCVVVAVRSSGSWLPWALLAGLATFAMAGQNAGSVVLLQMAVAVPVLTWWATRTGPTTWRRAVGVLAVLGGSTVGLSAYWLLPGLLATGSGSAVVAQTESGEAISAVSSWSEVVRGLGLWPLYGTDGTTPWVEPQVALLTAPLVVFAGFLLLAQTWWATAAADRTRVRLPVVLTAVAAVVMVGGHPWADPSPLGRVWQGALEQVPALGVLRTTNKAGAALVLGVALLAALAVAAARRPRRRAAVIAAVAAVAALPMWTGGLFVSSADVPGYWADAVAATDDAGSRLWLLPGQTNASYVWSDRRPDDVVQGLYDDREAMVRTTVANSTPQGASLLAGVDRLLQEGRLPPRALASVSRYLGVGTVAVRSDVDHAEVGGAAPALVLSQVAGSEGLLPGPTFGAAPGDSGVAAAVALFDAEGATGPVTAMDASALVTVVGDAGSVADLAQLGLLDGRQPFLLAADVADRGDAALLRRSARVVITDTNLRAEAVPNRLTEDRGPLLAATESAGRMAGIWTADDQSVRLPRGWRARATREGSAFRPLPWGAAENAVDGDPDTAWFAGDFGTAKGNVLTVGVGASLGGELEVRTTAPADAQITDLVLRVGDTESALARTSEGRFVGTLPATAEFSIRVAGVAPSTSAANVGIAEVNVAGAASPVADVLRTPLTLTRLVEGVAPDQRAEVTSRPVDVVLARRLGASTSPVVEEPSLHRVVELPWDDSFSVRGLFRLGNPMPETELDAMEGASSATRATSSSQAFGLPTGRASMALDGDEGTGWLPAEPAVGEELRVSMDDPVQTSEITLLQPTKGRQLTSVVVRVGETEIPADLNPGLTTVELPERTDVSDVTVTVTGVSEPATEPARLLEVGIGDRRIERTAQQPGCLTVAHLDGEPLRVRPGGPVTDRAFLGGPCGAERDLEAGPHEWASVDEFTSDVVVWSDDTSSATPAPAPVVDLGGEARMPGIPPAPGWSGELPERSTDVVVVAGVGYDPGWRLTVGGTDLGPPLLVNGHAAGWVVPAGGRASLALDYGPQRAAVVGLALSGAMLVAAGAVVVVRRRAMAAGVVLSDTWPRTPPSAPTSAPSVGQRAVPAGWGRWRAAASGGGWLVLGGLVFGVVGFVAAAAGLALRAVSNRAAGTLLTAGWGVVAAAWFWGARDLLGSVTPDLVGATSVAHACAGALLVATLVRVLAPAGGRR